MKKLLLLLVLFNCQSEIKYIDIKKLPFRININSFKESGFNFEDVVLDYDYDYKVYHIKKDSVKFKYNDYFFIGSFFAAYQDNKALDSFYIICNPNKIFKLIRKFGKFQRFELKNGNDLLFNKENKLLFIVNYEEGWTGIFKY